ncbi:MAG TPA: polyphosphate kinase 1 [Thermoanaerobaculia bacterium]|nr:polyphosphate kinase 1 [Thermoanaerobaculia bacterium]
MSDKLARARNREKHMPHETKPPEPAPAAVVPPPAAIPAPPTAAIKVPPATKPDKGVQLFNRELSWIEFNRRVLAEAENPAVPLLERLKFLGICSMNLDEFFMVRVGGIRELVTASITERSPDGRTPTQQLKGIRERARILLRDMYVCLDKKLLPELKKAGISLVKISDLTKKERTQMREYFRRHLAPILTPLAVDPGHPFPFLSNLALNIALKLEADRGEHFVFLKVPAQVRRLIPVPEKESQYIPVERLIAEHATEFFPGLRIQQVVPFRVIRNADLSIREDEVEDLLKSVESELRRRDRKEIVWIEVGTEADEELISLLMEETRCKEDEVFISPGLLKPGDLMQIYADEKRPKLKEPPFNPRIPSQLASSEDIFSIIRDGDILLHRPYDSFSSVVEFVQTASEDPDVVAIKQTLYRVDPKSPIVEALAAAALRGKQVTVVVELQARFDEMKNIAWARQLEEVGVQVVYGLVGIKTHCKLCLVVRREAGELRRYVHLSTGNYNANTGKLYTDIDLFTCDEAFGDDASQMMNLLTGFSLATVQEIFEGKAPDLHWKRFIVAPMDYRRWTIEMIEREARHAREGKPAEIIAKMNALVDHLVISALYEASQAGVNIQLIVRGICCLVPGVEGLSDRINVTSVVDRFLEHSRLFLFRNGGDTEVYASSGDWMPRNFIRRFETSFPLLSKDLKRRAEAEILGTMLADDVKAWTLKSDGTYVRRESQGKRVRSQERFIEIARSEAVRVGPYDETISKPGKFRRRAKKLKNKDKK